MGPVYDQLRGYWRAPPEIFEADPELSRIRRDIVWYSRKTYELGQPVSAPAKRLAQLDHQARLVSIPVVAPESERAALATVLSLRPELAPGEFEALMLTNEYRVMMGLHALPASRRLIECAREHSDDMRARNFFSHESPVPERRSLVHRARLCGYPVRSENIARDCATGAVAFRRWFNSSSHHRNMLDARHRRVGVGQSGGYYTQWFSHIVRPGTD